MRIKWIDWSKGLGILLVILGHTFCPNSIKVWLYSFHMPLFFFLSGYVFKMKTNSFKEFLISRIKSLFIPALIFESILLIYTVIEGMILRDTYELNLTSKLLGIIIQRRGGVLSYAPWFLICLFTTQIILYFFLKKIKNNKSLLMMGIISSFIGYIYCTKIGVILPWAIDASLNAILFFILGYVLKQSVLFSTVTQRKYLPLYIIINIVVCVIQIILQDTMLDMYSNSYGNYFAYILASISGIFSIITLSKSFNLGSHLQFIGENSIIYYSLHTIILSVIGVILQKFNIHVTSQYTLIVGLLIVFITCWMLYFIAKFYKYIYSIIVSKLNVYFIRIYRFLKSDTINGEKVEL